MMRCDQGKLLLQSNNKLTFCSNIDDLEGNCFLHGQGRRTWREPPGIGKGRASEEPKSTGNRGWCVSI